MRNKKRMLAAGLIAVALLSTVNGCGSTTGNMQDIQSIQGTTGVAGGTVQGSASAENDALNDSSGTSQAGVSQHATAGSSTMVNAASRNGKRRASQPGMQGSQKNRSSTSR